MNVVLVHGFISTGKIFYLMKKRFEDNGFKCFAPTLKPIDAKYGIEDLAIKLNIQINNHFSEKEIFTLIGFSMGGIICRHYLQELGGINKVNQFITISTPHHGSYLAYLYPGKGSRQLCPKSDFLKNLELKEPVLKQISIYSFRTPFDLMIIPYTSSIWNIASNKKYYSFLHSYMLFNPKVINDCIKLLHKYCHSERNGVE